MDSPESVSHSQEVTSEKNEQYNIYREQALGILEGENYLTRDEQGRTIIDLHKFRSKTNFKYFDHRMGPLAMSQEYGNGKWIPTLFHVFKNLQVYTPEEIDQINMGQEIHPKSLFYTPQNAEAALSIEEIRKNDFHMGLWEVGQVPVLPHEYPTLDEGNKSKLSTHEAITACLLYHPKYGNAERNEDGQLMVNFNRDWIDNNKHFKLKGEDKDYRRHISKDFFNSWGYKGTPGIKGVGPQGREGSLLDYSPVEFFNINCPNLVERDLIRPYEDFRVVNNKERLGEQIRKIRPNGLLWLGKNYSLGREFAGYSVYPVSDKYAVIININQESPQVMKIVALNTDPLPEEELRRSPAARKVIKKDDIKILDPEELPDLHGDDGVLIKNFKEFMTFSQWVAKEGHFNVLGLTLKEKSLATSLYIHHKENPRLWSFVKKYQLNGLRSLMAIEEAQINASDIWDIGEGMDATKVFSDVSQIVEVVTGYQESVRSTLTDKEQEEADEVVHTVLSYTSKVLQSLAPVVRRDPRVQGVIDIGDVTSTLRAFKDRVMKTFGEQYGLKIHDDFYQKILDVYQGNHDNPNISAVALDMLHSIWLDQAESVDKNTIEHVYAANDSFYEENDELFSSASETTGDTQREIDHFKEYLNRRKNEGKPVKGIVLDMGCGDGERITRPMAEALNGQAMVVGIDRQLAAKPSKGNISFLKGDFTKIPLKDNSVSLATAHWSVVNDLASRKLQIESFEELARVLEVGGELYFDVPHLEGGEGSWEEAAKEYHIKHPDEPYGMINATFPNDRNKEFYIYPEKELQALLEKTGFSLKESYEWRTESGKPRKTLVARLDHKVTPYRLAA